MLRLRQSWRRCCLGVACLTIGALASAAGAADSGPPGASAEAAAADDGVPAKLRVVVLPEYAPLEFTDVLGEPAGLLVEMWRLWSDKTGVQVELVPVKWSQGLTDVREGKADVVAFLFANAERRRTFELSKPFLQIPTYVYARKTSPPVHDIGDLVGCTVGVVQGDYAEGFLRKEAPEAGLSTRPTYAGLVEAAVRGDYDLFATEYVVADFYLRKLKAQDDFVRSAEPLYVSAGYAGVRKGRRALIARIDEGFEAIERADWLRMGERWCRDPELMLRRQTDRTTVLLAAGAGGAVALALLFGVLGALRRRRRAGRGG